MAGRYRIDAKQSQFSVQVAATGLLSVFGHNPTIAICGFGGDARFDPRQPEADSLLLLVQADSLAVIGDISDKERAEMERTMRAQVLEVARYPEILFISRSVTASPMRDGQCQIKMRGDLSLHGVTRAQEIDAQLTLHDHRLRAQGEFNLRQSDYQIKQVSVIGGTLKVKDDLKLSFDIIALEL